MLDHINIKEVIFLDIETVPASPSYQELSADAMALWNKKAQQLKGGEENPEEIYDMAGIYAEFGKVICISLGYFHHFSSESNSHEFRIKSFFGDDEKKVLKEFIITINQFYKTGKAILCAHNGKEFDFPYLARRILINGMRLPSPLDVAGKKPWEISHLDTMALWKFGDYKNYSSLSLLSHVFCLPSSKSDMAGSDVCKIYWEDKNLVRIVDYCQRDVVSVAQILLKYMGRQILQEKEILIC